MSYFLIDEVHRTVKSYDDLLRDLNRIDTGISCVRTYDTYVFMLRVVHSLAAGYPMTVLDADLSDEELIHLGIDPASDLQASFPVAPLDIGNFHGLMDMLGERKENWTLGLFTSGTTGRPKLVHQTFDTLTRNVKTGHNRARDVWGLAYNSTHIAGIQVFFQAFMNGNPIVNLFGVNMKEMEVLIRRYGVTHLSATPTYYRMALSYLTAPILSVKSITFGGEKYDMQLGEWMHTYFPNAIIRNIYASTELGAVLKAENDIFTIPERLQNDIRISDEKELLIHSRLLGKIPEHELQLVEGIWYATGDIVEPIGANQLRIIHRKTELINVGGYKVNPVEVEHEIKKLDGVMDVTVRGKASKLIGNVLIAEVVIREDASKEAISKAIASSLQLQSWKVPRSVYFVEALKENRNGKKIRL